MNELDPNMHQPTRLRILMLLSGVDSADFNFLRTTLGLSKGNLSAHTSRLQEAGYIQITKEFQRKIPNTSYCLTELGRSRLETYWQALDEIRASGDAPPS